MSCDFGGGLLMTGLGPLRTRAGVGGGSLEIGPSPCCCW